MLSLVKKPTTTLNTKQPLRVASISDIHLGNTRCTTKEIIEKMKKFLLNDQFLSEIDLLFIPGDVFDDDISMKRVDCQEIVQWGLHLLNVCGKNNVIVRVVEGTPKHDRTQFKNIIAQNEGILECKKAQHPLGLHSADIKYFSKITIDRIESLGIDVLYIPDEANHHSADTLAQVHELLALKGLEQVDFIVMHGMFHYQGVPGAHQNTIHDEEEYIRLCRKSIFVGHIHQASVYKKRIFAQGSFDRNCHGDEKQKGFWKNTYRGNELTSSEFIVNKDSKVFKTIRIDEFNIDEGVERVIEWCGKSVPGSCCRIQMESRKSAKEWEDHFVRGWPEFNWSSIGTKEISTNSAGVGLIVDEETFIPLIINENTILDLCKTRMLATEIHSDTLEIAMAILKESM